ncbi:MAG: hypothetical protein JXQ73_22450 [Phycisphaerae bacterium]|nr:hypothetical protein [Phycisphaerae bacterium]
MKRNLTHLFHSLLLLTLIVGCLPTPDLEEAFENAVKDAQTAEPGEISKDLTALAAYNDDVIWEGQPGDSRVLTVTWTDWDGYDNLVGQETQLTRDVWVTAVPEVQEFCRTHWIAPGNLTLRLEQLLGLPPNDGKTRFVELWADPNDLFRPSPDPEITDHEAGLDFPVSDLFVALDPNYVDWFNAQKQSSYGENGYPWTRLGYTYDWGNPCTDVGLSEFVIRSGANVTVQSVTGNEAYCAR